MQKKEFLIGLIFKIVSIISLLFLIGMIFFLFKESIGLFTKISNLKSFFFGTSWYPTLDEPEFGILPLLWGSLFVTFGALLFAFPLGISLAIFITEIADHKIKDIIKPIIEILAGIPSITYGFFGMVILGPFLQKTFNIPVGLCALNASLLLGMMALPTIVSVSADAISSIPKQYKEISLALGASRWETIKNVILPAAKSGIICSLILGFGRAIGETMTVMMVAGNAPIFSISFLDPIRTLTATIALEMGETIRGSMHYRALFALGCVLFLITLIFNALAMKLKDGFMARKK